jgi:hypothetical protein
MAGRLSSGIALCNANNINIYRNCNSGQLPTKKIDLLVALDFIIFIFGASASPTEKAEIKLQIASS